MIPVVISNFCYLWSITWVQLCRKLWVTQHLWHHNIPPDKLSLLRPWKVFPLDLSATPVKGLYTCCCSYKAVVLTHILVSPEIWTTWANAHHSQYKKGIFFLTLTKAKSIPVYHAVYYGPTWKKQSCSVVWEQHFTVILLDVNGGCFCLICMVGFVYCFWLSKVSFPSGQMSI